MAGEEYPWWAYSQTTMPQSQYCYYEEVDPYVTYEEQPYYSYQPQQYQQDVSYTSYCFESEEFQYQQSTPTFQSDEVPTMEEIRMLAKSNEESIKSLGTLVAQVVSALEQEKQQFILEATPENNGDVEQGTACIIEEDKFQEEMSVHEPFEEFDQASEVDDLVCAFQEAEKLLKSDPLHNVFQGESEIEEKEKSKEADKQVIVAPWLKSCNVPRRSLGLTELLDSRVRLKSYSKEAPTLELKLDHLRYVSCKPSILLAIVIATNFSGSEKSTFEEQRRMKLVVKDVAPEKILKWPL